MTQDEYEIDPELLEDGEHIVWASKVLKPSKKFFFITLMLTISGIFVALYFAYTRIQSWQHFIDVWTNPEVWRVITIATVALTVTWIIQNKAIAKGWIPLQETIPSEYFIGLITNQRLVLFSADREHDIVIRPGEVTGIKPDYSNGSPALRLALVADAPLPSITIVTSGDLAKAKVLIERGFVVSHKTQNPNDGRT